MPSRSDRVRGSGRSSRSDGPGGGIRIIYEDDAILVVDKPAGLLTVATEKETERTAFRILKEWSGSFVGVVHRLDRDTSGVLLLVKSREIQEKLREDWSGQVLRRTYQAVLEGTPQPPQGTVKNWLKKNKAFRVYELSRPEPGAEEAITRYKVLKTLGPRCLAELELETGRSNQIRVHMAGLGCPVAGDSKYGQPGTKGRLALHACTLSIRHPVSGEVMAFSSPLPRDITKYLYGDKAGA